MEDEYDDENILENIDDEDEEMVNENYKGDNDTDSKNNGEKMGPPNITIKPPGTKQKRRSKNDCNGRDYVCGCGKTYLSYPALYTHIKTKHNGKTPDGTNANQIQNGRGRGRPRKNFLINDDMMKRGREGRLEGSLEERHPEFKDIYNKQNNFANDYTTEKEEIYFNIFQTLGLLGGPVNPLVGFPDFSDGKLNPKIVKSYLPIYKKVKYILDNNLLNKLLYHSETLESTNDIQGKVKDTSSVYKTDAQGHTILTCDDIFAIFLIDNSQLFTKQFYKTVVIFTKSYRECMNKLGWEVLSQYKDINNELTNLQYTSVKNGEHLPEITEEFVNIYLPSNLPSFDRYLAVVLANYFCDWLYKHRFTNLKIKFMNGELIEENIV